MYDKFIKHQRKKLEFLVNDRIISSLDNDKDAMRRLKIKTMLDLFVLKVGSRFERPWNSDVHRLVDSQVSSQVQM